MLSLCYAQHGARGENHMNINDLNELTRDDLIALDNALIMLARYEHAATKNTTISDKAIRSINRIAVRYGLVPADGYAAEVAS